MVKHFAALSVIVILGAMLTGTVGAQGGINPTNVLPNTASIGDIIDRVINWAFGLLLVLAAVFILWAGFLYLTSGGDEEKTGSAKKYLIFAVWAIVVGALAKVIVFIVRELLGVF